MMITNDDYRLLYDYFVPSRCKLTAKMAGLFEFHPARILERLYTRGLATDTNRPNAQMSWLRRTLRKALERLRRRKRVRELRQTSQNARIAALRAELDSGVTPEQAERDRRYLEGDDDNGKK